MVLRQIRLIHYFHAFFWGLATVAFAQDLSITDLDRKSYGPNFDMRFIGSSAVIPTVWIPQATYSLQYTFLEPLGDVLLGSPAQIDSRFLRVGLAGHVSPWFSMFETQFGIRVIPRLEVGCNYQVQLYNNSNVDQAMRNSGDGQTLKDTWNAKYFFDNLYEENAKIEYSQIFGLLAGLDLGSKWWQGGMEYRFYLVDIRTRNDQKNIDFPRMLPVHKRDFFFETQVWAKTRLSEQWSTGIDFSYQQTGFLSRSFGIYDKESVQQVIAYWNVVRLFKRGKQDLSIAPGFFWRPEEISKGSPAEHLLLRAIWQAHWSWDRS